MQPYCDPTPRGLFDPTRAPSDRPLSPDHLLVAPKVAGSSPVGHPLTQVGTQRICVFCEGCETPPGTWVNRGPKEGSAAIVSS